MYNWQQKDWTFFAYDADRFHATASRFQEAAGQSVGILKSLSQAEQDTSIVTLLQSPMNASLGPLVFGHLLVVASWSLLPISIGSWPFSFWALNLIVTHSRPHDRAGLP